jgi:hypothetical protein
MGKRPMPRKRKRTAEVPVPELSEYELRREGNMRRNAEFLRGLGIDEIKVCSPRRSSSSLGFGI